MPPIVVNRSTMQVVDGMHRVRAASLRGEQRIEGWFVEGAAEDVFVLAVELNAKHGLPLSRKDRNAAARRIIESHPHWSDRRIASVTGLSPGAVGALRGAVDVPVAHLSLRVGRDGRVRPLNSASGRIAASQVIAEFPTASLREIASRAGVALATARDVRNRMRMGLDPVPPKLRAAEEDCAPAAAPGPADPGAAPVPDQSGVSFENVLARMRRDPSLRMSQTGRALLRLLGSHQLPDEKWRELVAGVPAHRAVDVAHAAQLCADRWLKFAAEVRVRRAQSEEAAPEAGGLRRLSPGA
ncbi:hypothetical protein ABGB09_12220 [Streptomyces sp. B8F3]|uniref:hypothetical protein n=1 Tax=Streptomyces sp. B8F3 TaxID=3153573 RepID=UPI00325E3B8D